MKKIFLFLFMFLLVGCSSNVQPTSNVIDPVSLEVEETKFPKVKEPEVKEPEKVVLPQDEVKQQSLSKDATVEEKMNYLFEITEPKDKIELAPDVPKTSDEEIKLIKTEEVNPASTTPATVSYIGNSNSKKLHLSNCSSVKKMSDKNKVTFSDKQEAISQGYEGCKICNP